MAIKDYELYHGAVLTRIFRKDVPTSLKLIETNKDAGDIYIINDAVVLCLQYRSPRRTEKHLCWTFRFDRRQLDQIENYMGLDLKFGLICVNEEYDNCTSEICILNKEQILHLIDLTSITEQYINVYLKKGCSFRVDGTMSRKAKELIVSKNTIDKIEIPA